MSRHRLLSPVLALILAGCGDDPTSPDQSLLVGRFGNPEQHAELVAIRGGAELSLPCGAYFTSPDPITIGFDQTFRESGQWYDVTFGGPVPPRGATLTGEYVDGRVDLTLKVDGAGGTSLSFTLAPDVSGELDDVACALTSAS